jgi:RNA polymerase sigma-70 factor (ECF subfamily)
LQVQNAWSVWTTAGDACLPEPKRVPTGLEPAARPESQPDADTTLAERCKGGSLSAFEELYRTHAAKMKSIAFNLLGNTNDAEDAVQETFLKVHRSMGSFQSDSAFSTWAFRILINTCYDELRKRKRTPQPQELAETEDEQPTPEPAALQVDHPLRLVLERSVQRLKPQYRTVFLLFEVEGFKHSEIAQMLDISVASSKNTLFQAKHELQKMILESRKSGKQEKS